MQHRRDFLKASGLLAAGAMTSAYRFRLNDHYNKKKIGLQLYTLRDVIGKDLEGTLARVAKMGYNEMEVVGYSGSTQFYNLSASAFGALLKKYDLTAPSGHYLTGRPGMAGTINNGWEKAVADAAALGQQYMVCAFLFPDERKTLDDWKNLAEKFNRAGETCRKAGIQFCYHNHDFEFQKIDGNTTGFEWLLKNTDHQLVKMEMDLYWVTKAGSDPVKWFDQYPGRFPLWHVKDMDNTAQHNFTEVGNGTIDFKRIFAHASKSGMQHYFVEQDKCPGSPFDSIEKSIQYLKAKIL